MVSATVELLEREAELDRLGDAVERAAAGEGSMIVVEGPAGIGKTELLAAGRGIAGQRGLDSCVARGSELERELDYGIARQLLERRVHDDEQLLVGAAQLAAPVLRPGTGTIGSPLEALHGLYWLCANLAHSSPLVLAIDDAHWADAPSARFLEYLARRVGELRLLVLVAWRTTDPDADAEVLLRLGREPTVTTLHPAPLSSDAVAALVRGQLAPSAEQPFCAACHEASGGNPFLVRELIERVRADGTEASAAAATRVAEMPSGAVARSVALRLGALPDAGRRLARAVAVLGGQAELRHAAGIAQLTPEAAAEAADGLAAAAILAPGRPLDFVHPLVRAAVYDAIPSAVRSAAHALAARLLDGEGIDAGRVAVHLLATEPAADGWVIQRLRTAARAALAHGEPRTAVSQLRRALAEPPPTEARGGVLLELGGAERRTGDPAAIDHLAGALALAETVDGRVAAARALAHALLGAGRVAELERVLDPALAEVDSVRALALEAEILSSARLSLTAGLWGRDRVERWRGRLAGHTPGERLMLANLATQTSLGRRSAAEAVELCEKAAGDGCLLDEQTADAMPFYQVVYVLISADRLDRAEALLEQASEDARRRGSLTGTLLASLFGAYAAHAAGDVVRAESRASLALELSGHLEPAPFHKPACLGAVLDVLIERDRLDEAAAILAAHGAEGSLPDSVPDRLLLYARGRLRMAQRHWPDAERDLRELGRRQTEWQALQEHLAPHDCTLAIVLAALEERGEAVELAERGLERARRWGTARAIGTALHARALAGPDDERLALLEEAARTLADSGARLDEARTLVDLGGALRRAKRRSDASAALRRALELAGRGGGEAVQARARQELAALGLRPRRTALSGAEALTGSERRVAELAAAGLTNREIAQTLFVTVRTVEVHLTHTYQKLEIRSRGELAGHFQRAP